MRPPGTAGKFKILPVNAPKGRKEAEIQEIAQSHNGARPEELVKKGALRSEIGAEVQQERGPVGLTKNFVSADAGRPVVKSQAHHVPAPSFPAAVDYAIRPLTLPACLFKFLPLPSKILLYPSPEPKFHQAE
jgi:hypothetical protein